MADVSYAVDVSGNQEAHQPWKGFGVHMGIAKATEGQHTRDAWFVRHITDIKAAGLVPAAYHFAWPNQSETVEAANYIAAVRPHVDGPFVHILDLEPYPNGAKNYQGASDAEIRAYATAWVAAVRKAFPGQRVLCYTPRDAVGRHFPPGTDGYWYPAYPVQGRSFSAAAKLARPTAGGVPVWGWQFASVPRDQTVIYMSPAALAAWAGGTPEDDVEITDAQITAIGKEAAHQVAIREWTDPVTGKPVMFGTFIAKSAVLEQTVKAQAAAIQALAAKVGSNDDTAAIVAAVEQAIANTVVHVDVDVTGAQPAAG